MTMSDYEELDNAYAMMYQDFSKMTRRGGYTTEEIAFARKQVDAWADAVADAKAELGIVD